MVIENQKKYGNQKKVLHKSPSNTWFRNEIHSLLWRADARGSADVIYHNYVTYIQA